MNFLEAIEAAKKAKQFKGRDAYIRRKSWEDDWWCICLPKDDGLLMTAVLTVHDIRSNDWVVMDQDPTILDEA